MKKRIALIFGGEGKEHGISEISAANLSELIDEALYDVLLVGISRSGDWYIYNGARDKIKDGSWIGDKSLLIPTYPVKMNGLSGFITADGIIRVCCAIPCLHGDFGEDGIVQGALTCAHIDYIGQSVCASAVTGDKIYTKLAAERLGIPTAKWTLETSADAAKARARAEESLSYPMFIKPASLGSSYGAAPVFSSDDFDAAYKEARALSERVLIEELVSFEYELECALFDDGKRLLSPGGRILSNGEFYDYSSKYGNERAPLIEAYSGKDAEIEKQISDYAERLSDFIGLRHLSRIDFFVTGDKRIYFNEINTFPGMTESSLYPRLTEDMGLKKGSFINLLIEKVCSYDRRV